MSINTNHTTDTFSPATALTIDKPVILKAYTVGALPAGTVGMIAYVTDALTPAFLVTAVGGGAVKAPVFFDGTNWVVI